MKSIQFILISIFIFFYEISFAQDRVNLLQDKQGVSSIYLFKAALTDKNDVTNKTDNPSRQRETNFTASITSPNADITANIYRTINKDKQSFYDISANVYSTKGLLEFAKDPDYHLSYNVGGVLGYRWLTPQSGIQVKWAYLKTSYMTASYEFLDPTNFTSSNVQKETALTTSKFDGWNISANLDLIVSNFTFGGAVGVTRSNNYEDLSSTKFQTYDTVLKDSINNITGTLGSSKDVQIGQLKYSPYNAYLLVDVFFQTFSKSIFPDFYIYYHSFNIAKEDSKQYVGVSVLFNLDKTKSRHLHNLGIRFQSNGFGNVEQFDIRKASIEILGGLSFTISDI